ncbi:Branched-chain amino acid transport system permease protein LivM (TC 3.A.1.4.1) [hydrothermal vent metagenome]|uniref:Branched-chain amino acid transport system permease protein LivM (TC 3.A.1.4.1) n=1 Tax=hydrothermal vent metagenome TaxID=652676 RepID=A0A3B1D1P5_9ZZZZ
MANPGVLKTRLKKFLLLPLWFALLAWPLMGAVGAVQLAGTLIVGALFVSAILRLSRSEGFKKAILAPVRLFPSQILEARGDFFKKILMAGGAAIVIILPLFLNNYYVDILSLAALYALLAIGLNITVGYTGLLDLGYAAFYGIGAYTYAILSTGFGLSFWLGLPVGAALAAFFGLVLGLVTLRLRGDYLAIITLGFVQIVYLCLNNWNAVTQGPNGIMQIGRPALGSFVFRTPHHFYYLILFFVVLATLAVHRMLHSQIGRAWIAIREDEVAAEAMGIDTTRIKTLAFVLGAAIAGVAGVLFAARYTFISPESFTFLESVRILSMVVLGGMGSLPGAILGAFLLTVLPEMLRGFANYRMLIFGLALVVMMVFRPQGLLGKRS